MVSWRFPGGTRRWYSIVLKTTRDQILIPINLLAILPNCNKHLIMLRGLKEAVHIKFTPVFGLQSALNKC